MSGANAVDDVHFIAEIGSSHQGDVRHAKSLIDAAAGAGATDIKFQWILADEIVSPHAGKIRLPNGMTDIYQSFKDVEREYDFYENLQEYTTQKGCRFFCSVFGTRSLVQYMQLRPDMLKIASPEINHILLLEEVATVWKSMKEVPSRLKILLSDGMALPEDLLRVRPLLPSFPLVIFHCVSQYPALPMQYQLHRLPYYQCHFTKSVGVSDHTAHPYFLPIISRLCGASYIEKHFTLTKGTAGLDDSFALTPHEFATMVDAVRASTQYVAHTPSSDHSVSLPTIEMATDIARSVAAQPAFSAYDIEPLVDHIPLMLAQHSVDKKSIKGFHTTRRSVFSAQKISKGATLDKSNTQLLRSEQNISPGIPAEFFYHVCGTPINTDVDASCPITLDMIDAGTPRADTK